MMNPTSTLTKLEVVNRVLQESGERAVSTTIENSAATKACNMLYSAMTAVNNELPWEDLISVLPLNHNTITTESTYVVGGFTGYALPNVVDVIRLHETATNKSINYAEWTRLSSKAFAAGVPTAWTFFHTLLFTYPNATTPANYTVTFKRNVPVPVDDSDVFTAPDYLVELYIKRLLLQFAQRHTGYAQLAGAVLQEYILELQNYANKYKITPKSLRTSGSYDTTSPSSSFVGTQS